MKKRYSLCLLFLLFIGIVHSQNVPNLPCPPHVRVNVRPNPICYGDTATLTAHGSGLTYLWSTGATTSSISVSPSSNTTYYVIGTNINGCPDTVRVTVKVDPAINASISASPANPCQGATVSLMANVSGGTLPYTYAWTPASPLNSSTIYNPTYVANITRTFTCTVKDSIGCSSVATKTVTVNTPPVANADSALIHYLGGDSVTATGGTPPYTYAWSPPLSTDLAVDPPTKPVEYTLTVTDANGCSSIDSAKLTPTPNTLGGCGSIFISGYVQDTVNHDDAIELYNPTGSSINLKTYYLEGTINSNALNPPFVIHLKGTIGAHKTFLIANRNADVTLTNMARQLSDSLNFNGKDIVTLIQIVPAASSALTTLLDKIGDISTPYGVNGWPVGTGGTKNQTLIRQQSIVEGDPIWSNCKNEWNVYPQGDFNVLQKFLNVCTPGDASLTLTLESLPPSCSNPSYVNFAIGAAADASTQFNSLVVDITVPHVFYPDNATDGIIVTNGYYFPYESGRDDYNILNVTNLSDSVIQIEFGDSTMTSSDGGTIWNLANPPNQLLNVSFKIQNCAPAQPICFTNSASATYTVDSLSIVDTTVSVICGYDTLGNPIYCDSSYSITKTYPSTVNYSSVDFSGGCVTPDICPLKITEYTNPINAGTNAKSVPPIPEIPHNSSILTIKGTGFGSEQGRIFVSNADNGFDGRGDEDMIPLDSIDIISWAPNLIVIKMPSFIADSNFTPGSGPFKIINSCGASDSANVQINYSILNDASPHSEAKLRPNVVMTNTNESFNWKCDTSIGNNPKAKACVKKALAEWNCYTGVNWKLGTDTTGDNRHYQDGISVIYFAPSSSFGPGAVMETVPEYLTNSCYDTYDSMTFYFEADISINTDENFSYDTSGIGYSSDSVYFYDAILHELGHAHGLGHINDTLSLMYWNTAAYRPNITSGRTWPGPGTLAGGLDMVSTSAASANSPSTLGCSAFTILHPNTKTCIDPTLSVPSIANSTNSLTLFPDPIGSGYLTISYQLEENAYIQFKIADCTGRILINLPEEHKTPGTYNQQINVGALAQGIYFFIANINEEYQTFKFIKL